MLDPVVSAGIKKYGVFKWACMEYPHLVFSAAAALFGVGFGVYFAIEDSKKREKMKYFYKYTVMRPDDPRLKETITFDDAGNEIYPSAK